MIKLLKKRKKNQGNSFIVVIATISFLMVLLTAILVAVALCYRLKAYDINTRDNFYYLEQAMDEIYAGVGSDSMELLQEAYNDTLEVMVYYDASKKSYVTMDPEKANEIMKTSYMNLLQNNDNYMTPDNALNRLKSFLSNAYDSSANPEGVQVSIGNVTKVSGKSLTIVNLVLKREASYSTVNAKRTGTLGGADNFIQTITTDLVIGQPDFDVNFNSSVSDLSELYQYAMIADMGVEIEGEDGKTALGDKVTIAGNVYAASDFYNKSYNENPNKLTTVAGATTKVEEEQIQKITSKDDNDLKAYNGVNTKSMYSGFYVDGANVIMTSERIIVPGTIAALNCADLTISSISNSTVGSAAIGHADIWADGIVLDGYALKTNVNGTETKGSSIDMKATAYIADDLELNAKSSSVLLNGEYYGYNYASTDNRVYTDEATKNLSRKFTTQTDDGITDGVGIDGQAHYNSSAIILNGEDTSLDFSLVDALYVAGQSYIEVSKNAKESEKEQTVSYTVTNNNGTVSLEDSVKTKSYSYYSSAMDADGNVIDDKNYTVNKADGDKTPVQDYRTGEAISIKSNQLAYIPNWRVEDTKDGLYLNLPTRLRNLPAYQGIWSDFDKIPVIKTVISGKTYYFLDFSKADIKDKDVMNQFIADYAALFDDSTADSEGVTTGEANGLIDITDYEYFQVKMLKVSDQTGEDAYQNIYSNSAITTKDGNSFTIVANSDNIEPLKRAAANINAAIDDAGNGQSMVASDGVTARQLAGSVTTKLQQQYKEVKWLLTNKSSNGDDVTDAHGLTEDIITPINHYFDFSKIKSQYCALTCGYGVWTSEGDVVIGASDYEIDGKTYHYDKIFANGKVKGLIIAKGDVTFKTDVEEFEGLIVSGSKIIVNNFDKIANKTEMNFRANEEIIKTVLRECDNSQGETGLKNYGYVCDIFRQYQSQYVPPEEATDTKAVSMRSISTVQFEDILSFQNWKKNVD